MLDIPESAAEGSAACVDCPMDVDAASAGTSAAAAAAAATGVAAATASAAALTSTATSGAVAASAAAVEQFRAEGGCQEEAAPALQEVCEASKDAAAPSALAPLAPAWDAHLDNPAEADPVTNRMMQEARRESFSIATDGCAQFIDRCEFVSLGCFCAVSNAMNLLGLKKNSYPFDWVRSSMDGIMHCLDMEFEDFLTYSTCNVSGNYIVFGGSRWGGSFWHHNVETPMTKADMIRRIDRFFGRGSVPAKTPRFFARVVNSSREILAAARLRDALQDALPDASQMYLLLIVDLQETSGLMDVAGAQGRNILFWSVTEAETQASLQAGGDKSFRLTSENYARALAAAVKCWAGETPAEEIRTFSSLRALSSACVHFDGGDASRELFTPKKFYGQVLAAPASAPPMQQLLARLRQQMFFVPPNSDVTQPLFVECFGKKIKVLLPPGSQVGNALQLQMLDGVLTGTVTAMYNNQSFVIGIAVLEELLC